MSARKLTRGEYTYRGYTISHRGPRNWAIVGEDADGQPEGLDAENTKAEAMRKIDRWCDDDSVK